jgi:hypothetical protein
LLKITRISIENNRLSELPRQYKYRRLPYSAFPRLGITKAAT